MAAKTAARSYLLDLILHLNILYIKVLTCGVYKVLPGFTASSLELLAKSFSISSSNAHVCKVWHEICNAFIT